jgi:hypothetical protein
MTQPNPYESPQTPDVARSGRLPVVQVVAGTLLLILLLPASGIAFFISCLAAVNATESFELGIAVGAVVGLLAAAAFATAFYFVARSAPPK